MTQVDGEEFPAFMAQDVMPAVAAKYRVLAGPEHTAIGGSSYGAVAAMYALLRRPDLFRLGLLESPSAQVGNGQMLRDTMNLMSAPERPAFDVGNEELTPATTAHAMEFNGAMVRATEMLAANFKAALVHPAEVRLEVQRGAHHSEQFWEERFAADVEFLFPAAKAAPQR